MVSNLQIEAWRRWTRTVFQPNNKELLRLLLTKADLLVDGGMPESAQILFVHVAGFDVLIQEWDEGKVDDLYGLVDYPADFTTYVRSCFDTLRERQAALLKEENVTLVLPPAKRASE
jgi:hypothetical protein